MEVHQKNSKYYPVMTYICKEVVKYVCKLYSDDSSSDSVSQIKEWIGVVKLMAKQLPDESVTTFMLKCSPHLVVAISKHGRSPHVPSRHGSTGGAAGCAPSPPKQNQYTPNISAGSTPDSILTIE